jgi:hypothetical protein
MTRYGLSSYNKACSRGFEIKCSNNLIFYSSRICIIVLKNNDKIFFLMVVESILELGYENDLT